MARRFGLGLESGVDLPGELPAMIPSRDWKLATLGEPWQGGETLISAVGQGFVLATPLQLAVMAARLASGRAVVPRLLRGYHAEPGGGAEAELKLVAEAAAAGDASVVSIAFDDSADNVREFFEENGGDWPVLVADTGKFAISYGVTGVPESYLVAPSGVVAVKIVGGVERDDLDSLIEQLQVAAGSEAS